MSNSFTCNQPMIFPTIIEALRSRAKNQPQKTAYTFLRDGIIEEASLTYQELDQHARVIAAQLLSSAVPGDRALLLYPPGLEFITAFFGCLYAGVIAIPTNLPRRSEKMTRLQEIMADAQTDLVLTTTSFFTTRENQFKQQPELASVRWLMTDRLSDDLAANWREQTIDSSTIAFLQYTSGSTGKPKGVILSHGNLLSNQRIIKTAFGHTETAIVVGWLPLFHDMGLIGNMLQPLYLGTPCIFMSPVDFLQQPIRWLQAISNFQATTSGGPNFAYDLCTRKITPEQRENLDLSSWEVAFIGAEPIRAETLRHFATSFAPCGFRWEAFYPCYGMAEITLFVTGGVKTHSPTINKIESFPLEQNQIVPAIGEQKSDREIVGCGKPWLDTKVTIVDPNTLITCPDGQVGEILVFGSSVAQGYWNRSDETKLAFHIHLENINESPFFRTGDLGFWQNGELFVTGRLKDTIIIRGCNHYPQDIELTVEESHPALSKGCGAAFSVEIKGEERLIVVHEIAKSYLRQLNTKEVIESIRREVVNQHALQVYTTALVTPGSIPKTSSGKIRRHACRAEFLSGGLPIVKDQNPYKLLVP
jgi:acyl-CoA synthetase (AMP-forming)/AMP-acid ligase II